jgi:predicted nucleic acid-binding protein
MANLFLPDSNIYITALRSGHNPFHLFVSGPVEEREFATCDMVMLEVRRGLRDPGLRQRFRTQFAAMIFLPTTNEVWERATQLAWDLDRRGVVLPAPDLIIAACALQADATVLTTDLHFQSVPGLRTLAALD